MSITNYQLTNFAVISYYQAYIGLKLTKLIRLKQLIPTKG